MDARREVEIDRCLPSFQVCPRWQAWKVRSSQGEGRVWSAVKKVWKKTRDEISSFGPPLLPLSLSVSFYKKTTPQYAIIIFIHMQIILAVLGENDFWGRHNFTSGNREGEEEREGEEQKRAPFFSPSSLLRKNPEGKKKALGFKMILDSGSEFNW